MRLFGVFCRSAAGHVLSGLHSIPYASLQPVSKARSRKSEPRVVAPEIPDAAPQPLMTDEILPIPKSLTEIYAVSNRNRRKNKEKKRGRGDEAADNSEGDVVEPHAASHQRQMVVCLQMMVAPGMKVLASLREPATRSPIKIS